MSSVPSPFPPLAPSQAVAFQTAFAQLDTNRDGWVQGVDCFAAFMQSGLPKATLKQVWDVVAGDDGQLNMHQFVQVIDYLAAMQFECQLGHIHRSARLQIDYLVCILAAESVPDRMQQAGHACAQRFATRAVSAHIGKCQPGLPAGASFFNLRWYLRYSLLLMPTT